MKNIVCVLSILLIVLLPVLVFSEVGSEVEEKPSAKGTEEMGSSPKITIKIEGENAKEESEGEGTEESEGENNQDIVSITSEDIVISKDQIVNGDVVGIGVNVNIDGTVKGDVACIGGKLTIGDDAVITGDVAAVGSDVSISDKAKISGEKVRVRGVPFLTKRFFDRFITVSKSPVLRGLIRLTFTIAFFGIWILITLAFIAGFRNAYQKILSNFEDRFGLSSLIGVLSWILAPVIIALLIASIIGILIVPLLILFWIIGGFIGASALCERLSVRFFSKIKSRVYLPSIVGIGLVSAPVILGRIVSIPGGLFHAIGSIITLIGCIILLIIFTLGFGGILLAIFRRNKVEISKDK